MFNIEEWLKSLQPGASGSMMPTQMIGDQPLPQAPVPTPRPDPVTTGAISAAPAGGPTEPGLGGMLSGFGTKLGTNDGTGGPTAFGGLLNFKDEDSKQAALRGLLGTSASLMAAGAPSDKPTSFLGNLGGAIGNGVNAYDGYKDGQSDRAYKNAQTARYGVASAQDAAKMQQEAAAAEARRKLFGGQGFNGGSSTGATSASTPASGSPVPTYGAPNAAPQPTGGNDLATQINTQRATYQRQYNGLMGIGDGENARPIFQQMNFLDNEAAKQGLVWDGTKYAAAPGYNEGLRATEAAKTAGQESEKQTDDIREYNLYVQQEQAAGRTPAEFTPWKTNNAAAGATRINFGDGAKYGPIPAGYRLRENADGTVQMEPIPGGPEATKLTQAQTAKDKKAGGVEVASDAVDTAFNNVIRVRNGATLPTNGFIGGMLSNVGGTGANDMRASLETLKAQASLSTLQKMREESPTGAGMGSPSDSEQKMIQAAYATLEQSQSNEEFIRNVNNFRNLWMDLVHGQGNGPERRAITYGLNPLTDEEQAAAETGSAPSTNNAGNQTIPTISGVEDFYKLAPGTTYIDPQGNTRTKR